MFTIKTWRIRECGWETYFEEVTALSKGRLDVKLLCYTPGVLNLVQKEQQNEEVENLA